MKRFLFSILLLAAVAWTWGTRPDREAYDQAKALSVEKDRTHVLSIFGKGSAVDVKTWYVNFYDPDSPSKGRVVVVQDGKVIRSHAAEGRSTYDDDLSFDPTMSKVTSETAMKTAKTYAEHNQIAYNTTTVLLRRPDHGKAPAWRVGLLQDGNSRGFVFVKSEDGALASYAPPSKPEKNIKDFGRDVESTFRGIGADLEEFFTGERTVDK